MEVISFLIANWVNLIMGLVGVIAAVIVLLKMIPGEQGESKLESAKAFLMRLIGK